MTDSQVQQVKQRTDIVEIIGEKLQLSRAGRSFRALCPFHSEKSPSFYVSPEMQVFRCFGCGAKGDAFSFLEQYDRMTFPESLRYLAERAGVELIQEYRTPVDQQRERILEIMELTAQYYHYILQHHALAGHAREYLKDRHVHAESIKHYRLGYSANSWDGLLKFLLGKKQYVLTDVLAAGLIIPRAKASPNSSNPRDFYDRFRGRIMFPLTDHRGRVVGFSGRTLDPDAKTAKYINSPETTVYHKSELLFGLSQHHREISTERQVIVVEGEFDVISSAQAHVRNVVAIKGSSLTTEHLQVLKRYVDTIVLSLDADAAGVEATRRAIEVARPHDVRVRVLASSALAGKDPDEVARHDPKAWREHAKRSISAYQFLIDAAFAQFTVHTGEGKQAIVKTIAPVLLQIPHAVERAHYTEKVAARLGVSEEILQLDLQRVRINPTRVAQPAERPLHPSGTVSPLEKSEQFFLHVLLHAEPQIRAVWVQKLSQHTFSTQSLQTIAAAVAVAPQQSVQQIAQRLPVELQDALSDLYLLFLRTAEASESELSESWEHLQLRSIKQQQEEVKKKMALLDHVDPKTTEQEQAYAALLDESLRLNVLSAKYAKYD